jgi:rRNA-processing protein FCF1
MLRTVVCYRIARDERFQRLPCMHKGTYADDCLVNRVTQVPLKKEIISDARFAVL